MDFSILGAFVVSHEGRPLPLTGAKPKGVLAILLLNANEIVSSDRLIEELWDSPPGTARAAVQVYVAQLRKLFDPDRARGAQGTMLLTRPPGYALHVSADQVDSQRFEQLLREGTETRAAGEAAVAAKLLREALAIWRGPALVDFTYEPFAQTEIARLEDLRITALEERIDADLALGAHADLIAELESLVTAHPLRDRLRVQLMLTLYRTGRQADALDAYMQAHRTLDEQLGIAPGPALQRLQEQILRQDPALESRREPATTVAAYRPAASAARKMVTILVAGLSTDAGVDPESLDRLDAHHHAVASAAIQRHGGTVESVLGDRVVGVFGVPRVHEDDALRAARAAVELAAGPGEPAARIGIASGEVVTSESEAGAPSVAGQPLKVAADLEDAAAADQILIDDRARNLLGPTVSTGRLGARVGAWRLLELAPAPTPFSGLPRAPIIGRDRELARLRAGLVRAAREREVQLITLIGAAGIGKTRLAEEFVSRLRDQATVVAGRCVAYGQGITFWPLREIVRRLTAQCPLSRLLADEADADLIEKLVAEAIGRAESTSSLEEIFWAFRRLLEAVARERPLVVLIEDIHWAEPALLDFADYLTERGRHPILLLCTARPELVETRPGWGEEKRKLTPLVLGRLPHEESSRLIDNIAGGISERTRARVLETAEGNPLFLEQMLAMLAEGSAGEGDVLLPPTIQAVLAARLDRLGPGERTALDTAAVAGKEFAEQAVVELLSEDARRFAPRHLRTLVDKDFLAPVDAPLGAGVTFRFRHVLIQQAAYRMIPKSRRATLHEQVAAWLEEAIGGGTAEHAERGGYHLEQAYRYREELGPLTDADHALATRAASLLAIAGRQAFGRGDMPAAANLLTRATSLLDPEDRATL